MSRIKVLNSWKDVDSKFVKVKGEWKSIESSYAKVNGVWQEVFSKFTPTGDIYTSYWDGSSSPTLTRQDDSSSMAQSDFDDLNMFKLKRVAVDEDGVVIGYHDSSDTDKWADGTDVNWSIYESDGLNCMVRVPKFYYKTTYSSGTWKWQISDTEHTGYSIHPAFVDGTAEKDFLYIGAFESYIDSNSKLRSLPYKQPDYTYLTTFRTYAENVGSRYKAIDYNSLWAIQLLYTIEYASLNSQSSISTGIVHIDYWGDKTQNTGKTNSLGNSTGEQTITSLENGAVFKSGYSETHPFSYRGIENLWGNGECWIDSCKTSSGGYTINDIIYSTSYQSVSAWSHLFDNVVDGFICLGSGGSESTYITDRAMATPSYGKCFVHGGDFASLTQAGIFRQEFTDSEEENPHYSRLCLL